MRGAGRRRQCVIARNSWRQLPQGRSELFRGLEAQVAVLLEAARDDSLQVPRNALGQRRWRILQDGVQRFADRGPVERSGRGEHFVKSSSSPNRSARPSICSPRICSGDM